MVVFAVANAVVLVATNSLPHTWAALIPPRVMLEAPGIMTQS